MSRAFKTQRLGLLAFELLVSIAKLLSPMEAVTSYWGWTCSTFATKLRVLRREIFPLHIHYQFTLDLVLLWHFPKDVPQFVQRKKLNSHTLGLNSSISLKWNGETRNTPSFSPTRFTCVLTHIKTDTYRTIKSTKTHKSKMKT